MAVGVSRKVFRLLKKLGIFGFSKKKNILFGLHPIFTSTAFICLTLILAHLARKLVKKLFNNGDSIVKQLLFEFIATLELCASCFELIIVADNWGVETYAIYLFLLTIWWSKIWETASACPYNAIEEFIEDSKDVKKVSLTILSQILGALVTFRYVQVLWSMELVETHRGRAFQDCTGDLQVSMIVGAVIEAIGTCMCRLTSRALSETEAKFGGILDAFFATMMVVAAFNFSGGYFNPALATSLKLGCEGNTFVEHMVVYWVGACVGSVLSVFIFRLNCVQNYVKRIKPKVE